MNTNQKMVLVSGAVVFKRAKNGRTYWLVVKHNEEGEWEIPKITVRKGESSVRAALRMMGEQADISARVLEEAGRSGGSISINGKTVPRRDLYYLVMYKAGGEILGFHEHSWHTYLLAKKKLTLKKEKEMLKNARQELRKWKKENKIQ